MDQPLWTPAPDRVTRANLTRFAREHAQSADFRALYAWSVAHPEEFWPAVWRFTGVLAQEHPGRATRSGAGVQRG